MTRQIRELEYDLYAQFTDVGEEAKEEGRGWKEDDREWTDKHMEAAGRLPKPSIATLTPPSDDLFESNNVDARGPGGYTPLMVASFCGAGIRRSLPDSDSTGSTDIDVEEGSAAIISELINQGAAINAKTDRTGNYIFLAYIYFIYFDHFSRACLQKIQR